MVPTRIDLGETVYNDDGAVLGTVSGYERRGFFVSTRDGVELLSIEHARSGHEFGDAHLMWRCTNCGEMREPDEGLPERCPDCGIEKRGPHVVDRRVSDATRRDRERYEPWFPT